MIDLLFPLTCPGCGRSGSGRDGVPICPPCRGSVGAAPVLPPPVGVDAWWAPFAYDGVLREVVARVKYRNMRAAVPWLVDAMVAEVTSNDRVPDVELVTWAPTTVEHRRSRGFDAAELLARHAARILRFPVARLLDRRPGPPQTALSGAARRTGPRFASRGRVPARVLLVDDVATTGATLAAAARALRSAGAVQVTALTAARTPPPS
jgi:predicted amidophosphoribosyltransferase